MRWKLACATVAVLLFVGVAMAEQFSVNITEVKDGKVTYTLKGKSDKRSLPVADKVEVAKLKFADGKVVPGDAIEGGLKNELFTKISKAGVSCVLTVEDDKITQVLVREPKKGK